MIKKSLKIKVFLFILCLFFLPYASLYANEYNPKEKDEILSLMRGISVSAEIIEYTNLYADKTEKSKIVAVIPQGALVQIIQDYSMEWYMVSESITGICGWLKREFLDIPPDTKADTEEVNKEQLERYMNIMSFNSDTDFFLLVDLMRQRVHLFRGRKGSWKLSKTFSCSSGKNESPTLRGLFKLQDRGKWFYSERLRSGAKYWVRFSGSYLFHSQAMDINKNIITENNEIGQRVSSGCIRLYPNDAEWIFKYIPDKTGVYIS